MKSFFSSVSSRIFFGLLAVYAFIVSLSLYLPQGDTGSIVQMPSQLPAPKIVMALASGVLALLFYGALGSLGLYLSGKIGLPKIWDKKVSNKQRFLIPGLIGAISGVVLIIGDLVFSRINTIGHFIHPPFPTSLFASLSAGIGEEILFRLFFVSFWLWLALFFSKGRWQKQLFWIIAVISALAFAFGHYPAIMFLIGYKTLSAVPFWLHVELILLNGLIGILAAYYFRKYGFLAAVGVHFWCDIIWHVLWGLF